MAGAQATRNSRIDSCEAYFEKVQSRKKIPQSLQDTLTSAFARIPVSSFPDVPGGKGIRNQISLSHVGDFTIYRLLAINNFHFGCLHCISD